MCAAMEKEKVRILEETNLISLLVSIKSYPKGAISNAVTPL